LIAAAFPRVGQGRFGGHQELIERSSLTGVFRHANARRRGQLMLRCVDGRRRDVFENAFRNAERIEQWRFRKHDHEFFGAGPADIIRGAQRRPVDRHEVLEHPLAGGVATLVIDRFEMVDADQEATQRAAVAPGPRDVRFDNVEKLSPLHGAGQAVGRREKA
jgi:hypothetical protein